MSNTTPTRNGYCFTGWNTTANGTGVDYPAGSTYTLPASGTDTLYAQWNEDQSASPEGEVLGEVEIAEPAEPVSGSPSFTG